MAVDGLLGAAPQFAGEQVPHDLVVVVVAVQAQRLTEARVAGSVAGEADRRLAVLGSSAGVAAGVAGLGPAGAAFPVAAGVLGDDRGCGRCRTTVR